MSYPILKIQSVTKTYQSSSRKTPALKGVDLEILAGKKVAIMGASGSGKSTLLHLCGGLTSLSGGEVEIEGTSLSKMSDTQLTLFRREKLGIIFQAFNLISTLNVKENILLPLYASNKVDTAAMIRLNMLVKELGIEQHLNHYVDELSGGEQQRVAIARALIFDPVLILADEPTGSLDSINSENVCKLLTRSSCTHSKTLLFVTHEPKVALYADEILVMKDGKICAHLNAREYETVADLALKYQTILS